MAPTFAELGVPESIVTALKRAGIKKPFPIQAETIPDLLAGRDVVGRAPTGSGKTLAFGIPLVARIDKADPKRPTALVLAPTRELAAQIAEELAPLLQAADRRALAVFGGVGLEPQIKKLRNGVDLLVATPGRLEDLIQQRCVTLNDVGILVIDEADRMADMGFMPVVRRLVEQTRADRQTVLYSATLDGDVGKLINQYQDKPVRHEVGSATPDLKAMQHHFWTIPRPERIPLCASVIATFGRTIVFTRTRHGADRAAKQLGRLGVKAVPIHGNRSQAQRKRALDEFANGRAHALVATDVAARGIHVDSVECVVHFDPVDEDSAYVHRSGRTARAGASGHVVSLIDPSQLKQVKGMKKRLGLPQEITPPPDVDGGSLPELPPEPEKPRQQQPSNRSKGERRNRDGAPNWNPPKKKARKKTGKPGAKSGGKPGAKSGGKPGGQPRSGGQRSSGSNKRGPKSGGHRR